MLFADPASFAMAGWRRRSLAFNPSARVLRMLDPRIKLFREESIAMSGEANCRSSGEP